MTTKKNEYTIRINKTKFWIVIWTIGFCASLIIDALGYSSNFFSYIAGSFLMFYAIIFGGEDE